MNCILTASRLYAVWLLFCGISACPFSELRSFRCGHLFCISGFMIMFTTEKVPNISSANAWSGFFRFTTWWHWAPICRCCCFLPCSNRPDTIFPIWSKVCCLFLLISAAERSSLWYGLAGPLTVKCCSICCFSLPFTSAWNTAVWSAAHFWWFWWEWYRYLLRRSHPGSLR